MDFTRISYDGKMSQSCISLSFTYVIKNNTLFIDTYVYGKVGTGRSKFVISIASQEGTGERPGVTGEGHSCDSKTVESVLTKCRLSFWGD